jgi:hypothetical protein
VTTQVQFRLLQLVVNHVADERVTLALVHWDGVQCRFAASSARVPDTIPSKRDIQRTLHSLRLVARDLQTKPPLDLPLESLFPIFSGHSGLLTWGAARVARTKDPARHFDFLVEQLGLRPAARARRRSRVSRFNDFAEAMAGQLDCAEIRTHHVVAGLTSYESPLSWKNGIWRHSFPADINTAGMPKLSQRWERLLGRVDACVSRSEVGVLVLIHDSTEEVRESLSKLDEHVQRNLAGRVEAVRAPARGASVDFSAVEDKVRADIAMASRRP